MHPRTRVFRRAESYARDRSQGLLFTPLTVAKGVVSGTNAEVVQISWTRSGRAHRHPFRTAIDSCGQLLPARRDGMIVARHSDHCWVLATKPISWVQHLSIHLVTSAVIVLSMAVCSH